jgi:hypothetical protein
MSDPQSKNGTQSIRASEESRFSDALMLCVINL